MILEVFLSYAHQDQQFRNELDKHLSNLRRQGIISSWSDGDIAPGTEWRRQVMNHLDTARIILLLISADFMASDFCYSIEMTRALERHQAKEARVLPIILRPTDWKEAPKEPPSRSPCSFRWLLLRPYAPGYSPLQQRWSRWCSLPSRKTQRTALGMCRPSPMP